MCKAHTICPNIDGPNFVPRSLVIVCFVQSLTSSSFFQNKGSCTGLHFEPTDLCRRVRNVLFVDALLQNLSAVLPDVVIETLGGE